MGNTLSNIKSVKLLVDGEYKSGIPKENILGIAK